PFNEFFPSIQFKGKGRIFKLYNKITNNYDAIGENIEYCIKLLQKGDFDIFHATYYNPYFLKFIQAKPFVLNVFDMIHEIYPEYYPLNDPIINWKKLLIKRAAKIITISKNTKKDIMKFYDVAENKIEVIHLNSNLN